ncbi:insulin gene enhancer protein ISL-1 isoform X2 [Lingula anatina]|uniref:Insulin gene enhancer protein ISL-1 n=1 Tax=Lingula anatina TaxID=7574 RepID=A0A1S3IMQ5_LINAN|nr:insulin gene enhancer protein ISL-1 isoform X2 [Lingula anatina]|eukprot:XP_013399482.1 insulin gene enhancer protein ISL-1 isoform X2 [Lingula anatina]
MAVELQPNKKRRSSLCVGCGGQIQDQFILRVAPDLEWHASCLKCTECSQYLDESCTCFVRDGKTYCKRDYVRLFGTKCAKCNLGFSKNDFVMRARNKIYHIDCFRCVACSRQLIPGDEFALREDGLFCKADHDVVERASAGEFVPHNNNNNDPRVGPGGQLTSTKPCHDQQGPMPTSGRGRSHKESKTTRVRTVLNEKQLHTLRTCYAANPRPDALMKEQLVEMTALSPRVIRVWFQNKRCKDKKKSILMKQIQQQQEKNGNRLQGPLPQGVPMVASSPVRHESGMQGNPVEVQSYQQSTPWHKLADYGGMQGDIDQPPFQQLVESFDHCDTDDSYMPYLGDDSSLNPPSATSSDAHDISNCSEMSSPTSS